MPPCWQRAGTSAHSLISVSHFCPVMPAGHLQENWLAVEVQVLPFAQGWDRQASVHWHSFPKGRKTEPGSARAPRLPLPPNLT